MQGRESSMNLARNLKKLGVRIKPKPAWKTRPEILLCRNVPKPLHGVAPREIMGGVWWDKTRKAAYRSTNFHCVACGMWKHKAKYRQWLEAHEVYEIDYLLGRMTYVETVPLCHLCHNYIHSGRLDALFERGEVSHKKFRDIHNHGDRVLKEVGLHRLEPPEEFTVEWGDWRLVLNGKEYPPKHKTQKQWEKFYAAH